MVATDKKIMMTVGVWLSRIVLGGTFVFSGFVKAVDVWGTIFKIEQYFAVWHLGVPRSLVLALTLVLCITEFVVGVSIISGIYRKKAPVITLLILSIFTLITAYIVLFSPVEDCGCFGDAVTLSNTATFIKNVILLVINIFLLKVNVRCAGIFSRMIQWAVAIVSMFYIIIVSMIGYMIQPVMDFRTFPEGTDLIAPENDDDIGFIYEKNGVERMFKADSLPQANSGWSFKKREESKESWAGLTITDVDGEDVTEDVINSERAIVLLVIPEKEREDVAVTMYVNRIYEMSNLNDMDMAAVIGNAVEADIEEWRDISMAKYPIYSAEETQLKDLCRGEMALVYIIDGKVVNKYSMSALSNTKIRELETGEIDFNNFLLFNGKHLFRWITETYLLLLILLFLISAPWKIRTFIKRMTPHGRGDNSNVNKND